MKTDRQKGWALGLILQLGPGLASSPCLIHWEEGLNPEKRGEGMTSSLSEGKFSTLLVFNFSKGRTRKTGVTTSIVVRL